MRKFELLLSPDVFLEYYYRYAVLGEKASSGNIELRNVFDQHRIILSPEISKRYKEYAAKRNKLPAYELINLWLSSRTAANIKNSIEIQADEQKDFDTFEQALVSRIQNGKLKDPVVLYQELSNYYRTKEAVVPAELMLPLVFMSNEIINPLARNTLQYTVSTKRGEDSSPYKEWFSEIMGDVKQIMIFDRYIFFPNEFFPLCSFLFDAFPNGATIDIYQDYFGTADKSKDYFLSNFIKRNQKLKMIAENQDVLIRVFDYDHSRGNSYHDRRIFFSNQTYALVATQGYGSLPSSGKGKITKSSYIFSLLDMDWKEEMERIFEDCPDYYLIWDTTRPANDLSSLRDSTNSGNLKA